MDEQFKKWLTLGMDFSAMAQKSMENLYGFNTLSKFSGAPQAQPEGQDSEA